MSGFRLPELSRDEMRLFSVSLDDAIPQSHPVRLFDMLIRSPEFQKEFAEWEKAYHLRDGRPPYHPRYLAALYLYGMMNRMRSSRQLEQACHNRIDVKWLMDGQTPDHATISAFVHRHGKDLKRLFRTTVRVAIKGGMLNMQHLVVDGTKVEADASIHSVHRKTTIEAKLAEIEQKVAALEKAWEENEKQEESLFGSESPWVPSNDESAEAGKRRLEAKRNRILDALRNIDRRQEETSNGNTSAPVASTTDPDARHMMDKKGLVTPAYNTQIAVDATAGVIVAESASDAANDIGQLPALVEQATENAGVAPTAVIADSGYNTGADLATLEAQGIETYMPDAGESAPVSEEQVAAIEAAHSGSPLSESQIDLLMDKRTKKLGRLAFRYDQQTDTYKCPMGATLERVRTSPDPQTHGISRRTQYVAKAGCVGCPLAPRCLSNPETPRMVTRDQFEDSRNRLRGRMRTPEGRATYRKRAPTVETRFAVLKHTLGIRRFMRRGIEAVSHEWTLICTAINMATLLRAWSNVVVGARGS